MRLVEDLGAHNPLKPNYLIITGDGRTELHVLRGLSKKFNGHDIILFFPFSSISRKTGLSALDSLKHLPKLYGINSIIYIVDGDTFNVSAGSEIQERLKEKLDAIAVEIVNVNPIQNAYLFNCKIGGRYIILYCIILGPESFIEEEIVDLIKVKWRNVEIDLSGTRDSRWKKRIKKELAQILKEKGVKGFEALIESTGKRDLESAFPNICAVFKKIEEENQ